VAVQLRCGYGHKLEVEEDDNMEGRLSFFASFLPSSRLLLPPPSIFPSYSLSGPFYCLFSRSAVAPPSSNCQPSWVISPLMILCQYHYRRSFWHEAGDGTNMFALRKMRKNTLLKMDEVRVFILHSSIASFIRPRI
jgi:hypothetical protein